MILVGVIGGRAGIRRMHRLHVASHQPFGFNRRSAQSHETLMAMLRSVSDPGSGA